MAMATDIFGLNKRAIQESYGDHQTINLEQELADVEPIEEGVDPLEFMVGVAYECELDMQRIDMAIIGEEYNYLRENGEEMVYEANAANNIIDRFKDWVEKLWRKIQSFFKSILSRLSDKWLTDEKFAKKYKNKIPDPFPNDISAAYINISELDKLKDTIVSALGNADSAISGIKDMEDSSEYEDEVKKARQRMLGNTDSQTIGKDGEAVDDLSLAKIARYHKVDLSNHVSHKVTRDICKDAIDQLENTKLERKLVEQAYLSNKKMIASAKKAAKMMESMTKKFKVLPTEESHKIHYRIKVINKIGGWNSKLNKYAVQVINMKSTSCRSIIVASVRKDTTDKKLDRKHGIKPGE